MYFLPAATNFWPKNMFLLANRGIMDHDCPNVLFSVLLSTPFVNFVIFTPTPAQVGINGENLLYYLQSTPSKFSHLITFLLLFWPQPHCSHRNSNSVYITDVGEVSLCVSPGSVLRLFDPAQELYPFFLLQVGMTTSLPMRKAWACWCPWVSPGIRQLLLLRKPVITLNVQQIGYSPTSMNWTHY